MRLKGEGEIQKLQGGFNFHPDPKNRDKSVFVRATCMYVGKPWDRERDEFFLQVGYATPIVKFFGSPEQPKETEKKGKTAEK